MKHLKPYKIFESNSNKDIIEDCRDILLDISDNDIKCDIVQYNCKESNLFTLGSFDINVECIIMQVGNYRGKLFDPGYYVETFDHLNSYLNSNGYYYLKGTITKNSLVSKDNGVLTWEENIESINRFKGTSDGKLALMSIYWVKDLLSFDWGIKKRITSNMR